MAEEMDKNVVDVEVEEEEMEMTEKKGLVSKVVEFGKKHGKKLAIGAGVLAVGLLGYKLGHGSENDGDSVDYLEDHNSDPADYASDVTDVNE